MAAQSLHVRCNIDSQSQTGDTVDDILTIKAQGHHKIKMLYCITGQTLTSALRVLGQSGSNTGPSSRFCIPVSRKTTMGRP